MSEAPGYAAFLQNAGLFFRVNSHGWHPGLVCDAPSAHVLLKAKGGAAVRYRGRSDFFFKTLRFFPLLNNRSTK